jgi:DNA polymerase III psi subunit
MIVRQQYANPLHRPVSPLQMTVLQRLNAQCRHVVCREETALRTLNQGARNNSWVLRRSRADLKRELWGF